MILADIQTESTQRIVEVREFLDAFAPDIPPPPAATPRHMNTMKGLVFVQLYGVVEFTILQTLLHSSQYINAQGLKLIDIKPYLWSIALDSQLEALNQANTKKWDVRSRLFQEIGNNSLVDIRESVIPTDGKNITSKQLQSIWTTFSINDPLFSDPTFQWRLRDIVTNRVNIAHGNSSAAIVGSSTTIHDLYQRLSDVSGYCSYFISVFEDYLAKQKFMS
jgi:hypothetical protein